MIGGLKQWSAGEAVNASDLNGNFSLLKFGGTGADGALSISSGTTTLSASSASVLVKNYTSISITGTGKLAFSNKAGGGTIVVLKSQGNVTLTSSTTPCIELTGYGADSGGQGNCIMGIGPTASEWGYTYPGSASTFAAISGNFRGGRGMNLPSIPGKALRIFCGAGGGTSAEGVAGGVGGGGLYIECGGALNFTGTIWSKGGNGTNGNNTSTAGHNSFGGPGGAAQGNGGDGQTSHNSGTTSAPGGGAGGGSVFIICTSITTNTGTITLTGGSAGSGSPAAAGGADGYSYVGLNTDLV